MALPTTNMLCLPFKKTHSLSVAEPIKQYISTKYDQHPDMFTSDLNAVDELRKAAVSFAEPHSSGIKKLQAYAAQLVWMVGKFPIDLGAEFTWYPSLGYETDTPVCQNNIRFELANVLFNLAVLYCQLAYHSNRTTSDGLKSASNYFCLGAGVLSHIKNDVIPDMRSNTPEDMDALTLECLEQLLLAQAQECFWQKARNDNLKDASIAKLAARVSDLYRQAYEFGTRSNTISSEWIHHMNAKHHHFAAVAQFRAACDCLEKQKYGEEIARLQDSLACTTSALKESRYVNKAVLSDLNGLKTKVQEDLKRAEKDNDTIYLMPIPPKSELRVLDRANMVSSKIPPEVSEPLKFLGDSGELGKPLFSKLVPYAVHLAASIYASRRDQTINSLVEELEALTARIHSLLQSLKLPGSLQALEKPLGLPPGLVSHAEEIRQQKGLDRIRRSIEDVEKLKSNNKASYQRGVNLLEQEAAEDEQALRKYGTERWTRPASAEAAKPLLDQATQIDGYFKGADESDSRVRKQCRDNEALINLLNGPDRAIEDYVPSSRRPVITPTVDREVNKLRAALNDLTRLESRRRRKIESLRNKAQSDDVNPELLKEAARLEREWPMQAIEAVQFEDFFDKRQERYTSDRAMVEEERNEQSQLLSRVAEANTSFSTARHGDTSTKEREKALQKLENAYFAYKEIIQNLEVGRTFYNKLSGITGKFNDDCRNFAYQRRAEAAQLEADITTALPMANLSLGQTPQLSPNSSSTNLRPVEDAQPIYNGRVSASNAPLAAPVPVKPPASAPVANMNPSPATAAHAGGDSTWKEGMAINFAGMTTPQGAQKNGGGSGPATGTASRGQNTAWNPNMGMKFG